MIFGSTLTLIEATVEQAGSCSLLVKSLTNMFRILYLIFFNCQIGVDENNVELDLD